MKLGQSTLLILVTVPISAGSNWLLQCSACVDQSLYSDMSLKSDIRPANLSALYEQLKTIRVREFTHIEQEFFNRFFPRTQLGVVAQELEGVVPGAVSLMPERRWSHLNGTQMATKNVHMVREAHLLFTTMGATQEIIGKFEQLAADYWGRVSNWGEEVGEIRQGMEGVANEQGKQKDRIEDAKSRLVVVERDTDRMGAELREAELKTGDVRAALEQLRNSFSDDRSEVRKRMAEFVDSLISTGEQMRNIQFQLEQSVIKLRDQLEGRFDRNDQQLSSLSIELGGLQSEFKLWVRSFKLRIESIDKDLFTSSHDRSNLWNELRALTGSLAKSQSQTTAQFILHDNRISSLNQSIADIWSHLSKEAHADLIEKRKAADSQLAAITKQSEYESIKHTLEMERIAESSRLTISEQDRLQRLKEVRDLGERAWRESWDLNMLSRTEEVQAKQQKEKLNAEREMLLMKLEVEREKLKVDLAAKVEQARIDAESRLQDKRMNEDINLREMQAKSAEDREHTLQAIREVAGIVRDWLASLYGAPENIGIAVGSIVLLAAGIYFVREAAILAREQLNKHLGKPSLVRMTSRRGRLSDLMVWVRRVFMGDKGGREFDDVVLSKDLFSQIKRLANATKTAKTRGAPLLNCMFYGPPGTGKTMVAKRFAEYSGLEYAIMCGGDVAPLGDNAVTELHNLFKWVHKSRKGVLLFIDEAESFLGARHGGMSENMKNALTAMLYHTGTASSQFMLIMATNRPGDLDAAVLDRIDESIEFGLPDVVERQRLVKMYYDFYVTRPSLKNKKKPAAVDNSRLEKSFEVVAGKITGFSGREISKLFMSLQTHVYSLGLEEVTDEVLFSVTDHKVAEHHRAKNMQKNGYIYDASTAQRFNGLPSEISTDVTTTPVASPVVIETKPEKNKKGKKPIV